MIATDAVGEPYRLTKDEVGLACGRLTRLLGQGVVHLTRSELTRGSSAHGETASRLHAAATVVARKEEVAAIAREERDDAIRQALADGHGPGGSPDRPASTSGASTRSAMGGADDLGRGFCLAHCTRATRSKNVWSLPD